MKRRQFIRKVALGTGTVLASQSGSLSAVSVSPVQMAKQSLSELRKPVAIAMWDFSWILRHHRLGEFANWDKVLDELAERGYNAIRFDCMPQFVAANHEGHIVEEFRCVKDNWKPALWGNDYTTSFRPRDALLEFLPKCYERGIKVGLATWFLQHGTERSRIFIERDGLFRAWDETLTFLHNKGLLRNILYVDVLNEYPFSHGYEWLKNRLNEMKDVRQYKQNNPDVFVPDLNEMKKDEKFNPLQKTFFNNFITDLLTRLKQKWPEIDFFASLDSGMPLKDIDLTAFAALDYHIWFVHNDRMSKTGYNKIHSMVNDQDFDNVYKNIKQYWHENRSELIQWMDNRISTISDYATKNNIPCGNTEGWGPIMWIDHPALDWDWVKETGEICVDLARQHGYSFICTSNFTHPQFPGLWKNKKWHQKVTQRIKQ